MKTIKEIDRRVYQKLKHLPKKYTKKELSLIRKIMFEEILNVMFEEDKGIRIQNFGNFKLIDKFYRSKAFGNGKLQRAKTISFNTSRNFQKYLRKRLEIKDQD